jgi:CBS domain containing-hemolysin-like protein
VGDIADEFEKPEALVEKQPDGSYLSGAMLEVEVRRRLRGRSAQGVRDAGRLPQLAGGSIPEVGDRFTYDGWQFTVASKRGRGWVRCE